MERLHGEQFPAIRAAKDAVLDWLLWYNRQRMHSTLNYVSPAPYEQAWNQKQQGRGTDDLPESMEETMTPFLPPFPQTLEIACGDSHTSTATTTTGIQSPNLLSYGIRILRASSYILADGCFGRILQNQSHKCLSSIWRQARWTKPREFSM